VEKYNAMKAMTIALPNLRQLSLNNLVSGWGEQDINTAMERIQMDGIRQLGYTRYWNHFHLQKYVQLES
jgi:hypothetical protein